MRLTLPQVEHPQPQVGAEAEDCRAALEPLECGRQQRQGWPPVLPHRVRAVTAALPAADRRAAEVEEAGRLL